MEVLISCMNQIDSSIIQQTNIQSNVLIINQCSLNSEEFFTYLDNNNISHTARVFHTTERGLARSRNMAICHAMDDFCLLCDDDEVLEDNYNDIITNAFKRYPQADIITFNVYSPRNKKYPVKVENVGYIGAMRTSSWEIAFRRESIIRKKILFDTKMGSGTGNGGGEEVRFLFDCLKNGLKIIHVPIYIATVRQTDSQWFHGYTDTYFINQGWISRRLLGFPLGLCYIVYTSLTKYSAYKKDNTFIKAFTLQIRGMFKNVK